MPSILLVGWLAFGISQVAASRVSSEDDGASLVSSEDDDDEDFQTAFQTVASLVPAADDDVDADVSVLMQNVETVQAADDDIDADVSILMQNAAGSFAKTASSDEAKHKGISARAEEVVGIAARSEKSMGQAAGQSLELQGMQVILAYMERIGNTLRVKVHEVPLAFGIIGIGLVVLGLALAVMIICVHMRKGQMKNEYEPIDGEEDEVWEKVSKFTPERKLVMLFEELLVANRSAETPHGCITATDLQNMMKDMRVAKELSELGISTEDSMAVFNLLAQQSHDASVNLEEFVAGCVSSEGKKVNRYASMQKPQSSGQSVRSGSSYAGSVRPGSVI